MLIAGASLYHASAIRSTWWYTAWAGRRPEPFARFSIIAVALVVVAGCGQHAIRRHLGEARWWIASLVPIAVTWLICWPDVETLLRLLAWR
jgi:hypothetical protein